MVKMKDLNNSDLKYTGIATLKSHKLPQQNTFFCQVSLELGIWSMNFKANQCLIWKCAVNTFLIRINLDSFPFNKIK